MPTVRFSNPARHFSRLGSCKLQAETEPDDVRIGDCSVTLNPVGEIACDVIGLPTILNVDWGTGVVVRPTVTASIDTVYTSPGDGPSGTEFGLYSITAPPTFSGVQPITTTSNCSWEAELTEVSPALTGNREQLLSGTDVFSFVYSPPHQAPLVQTSPATTRSMKFVFSIRDAGGGFYTFDGFLTHQGTASYDGEFIVNDTRHASNGGNYDYQMGVPANLGRAPAASRPWYDWWRNTGGTTYQEPNSVFTNGATGRRREILNSAGTIRYETVGGTLTDWAAIVASGSLTMNLSAFGAAVSEWGFITSVPDPITISW